jgi:antitoxin component of MazEF toxin-antitoxin module
MQSSIIQIGNSKGVRLSKKVLILSGLSKDIDIQVKEGEIKIVAAKKAKNINDFATASQASFAKDWPRP